MTDPYHIVFPSKIVAPVLISSPHSGRHYPPDFIEQTILPIDELRRTEDRFVDRLFVDAPAVGAILLTAEFGRSWIDLNRDFREVDLGMFDIPPAVDNPILSTKVRSGFGLFHKNGAGRRGIYRGALPVSEYERRLSSAWVPYHEAISSLLAALKRIFGYAILIDVHSMPPLAYSKPYYAVIGDRYGKSCTPVLTDYVEAQFKRQGFPVRRNTPYAGGYITEHYGCPENNIHAIQIEICRSRYLNLSTLCVGHIFERYRISMKNIISKLMSDLDSGIIHLS